VGKEVFAEAIHKLSPRHEREMIRVNCSAIPSGLIESELFGHERGAFTGAFTRQIGRFEAANQSTLFLDEIGELSPEMQIKLLRVLENRVIERVGGQQSIKVDVRIIAATNRNLEQAVDIGDFRHDLFYRPFVFPIVLPPLRTLCLTKTRSATHDEPRQEVIAAVVDMKQRNPSWGCPRIAQQITLGFGIPIDRDVVRRILAARYEPPPNSAGPSWLSALGHAKDSLWTVDLFRCESAVLHTRWVLVDGPLDPAHRRFRRAPWRRGRGGVVSDVQSRNPRRVPATVPQCGP